MTSDDQHFLDYLNGVSSSVSNFVAGFASDADKTVSNAVESVRQGLRYLSGRVVHEPPAVVHRTFFERTHIWISRHRAVTAAVVAFVGTGAIGALILYSQASSASRKRRARKAKSGARKEVVVIAGAPNSALLRSLYLDLDRRGFVVYVIVTSSEEKNAIERESKPDIIPLTLDLADPQQVNLTAGRFGETLDTPHQAFPGAEAHHLELSGLILAPDVVYPTGSIQDLGSDVWTDALSTKVLSSINVTRVFLPLLSHNQSRILILTPSIINTLNPSQNGVESVSVSALEAFTRTLRRETKAHNVSVSHIRMGSFDFGSALSKSSTLAHSLTENGANQGIKVTNGSHPRELHYAVFDALTMSRPFISRRVGRGSLSYDIMGSVMSASIIDWMLNVNHSTGHDLSRSVEGWEKVESHN